MARTSALHPAQSNTANSSLEREIRMWLEMIFRFRRFFAWPKLHGIGPQWLKSLAQQSCHTVQSRRCARHSFMQWVWAGQSVNVISISTRHIAALPCRGCSTVCDFAPDAALIWMPNKRLGTQKSNSVIKLTTAMRSCAWPTRSPWSR